MFDFNKHIHVLLHSNLTLNLNLPLQVDFTHVANEIIEHSNTKKLFLEMPLMFRYSQVFVLISKFASQQNIELFSLNVFVSDKS